MIFTKLLEIGVWFFLLSVSVLAAYLDLGGRSNRYLTCFSTVMLGVVLLVAALYIIFPEA